VGFLLIFINSEADDVWFRVCCTTRTTPTTPHTTPPHAQHPTQHPHTQHFTCTPHATPHSLHSTTPQLTTQYKHLHITTHIKASCYIIPPRVQHHTYNTTTHNPIHKPHNTPQHHPTSPHITPHHHHTFCTTCTAHTPQFTPPYHIIINLFAGTSSTLCQNLLT
jgi:hypothetical protein